MIFLVFCKFRCQWVSKYDLRAKGTSNNIKKAVDSKTIESFLPILSSFANLDSVSGFVVFIFA